MNVRQVVVVGVLALGCGKGEAPTEVKAAPISKTTRIEVEIDGQELAPIDAARLEGTAPDFAEGPHKAWRLASLLGEPYTRPDAVLEIVGVDGVKTVIERPAAKVDGKEPVLTSNLRGEVLLALVRQDDPFPSFHGRGGNRGRKPEEETRVKDVRRIRIYRAGSPAP